MCEHVGLVQLVAISRALLSFALKGLHRTLTVTVCWKPHPCVLFRCPLFRVHHSSVILHDPFGCRGAAWKGLKNLRHLFKTVPMGQSNPVPFLSPFFFYKQLKMFMHQLCHRCLLPADSLRIRWAFLYGDGPCSWPDTALPFPFAHPPPALHFKRTLFSNMLHYECLNLSYIFRLLCSGPLEFSLVAPGVSFIMII